MASRGMSARRFGYIVAIVINAILLWFVHNLPEWAAFFVTEEFSNVLWAIDLSLGATILANFLFIGFSPAWFVHPVRLGLNILALLPMYVVLQVFPFDFRGSIQDSIVRFALTVAMIGIGIGILVEAVGSVRSVLRWETRV